MKRTPLRRHTPLRRTKTTLTRGTRVSPISDQRRDDQEKYKVAKAEWFEEHPNCQFPGCPRSRLRGHLIDLHHKAGRNGPLLYCKRYFSSLCRPHHDHVENHLSWARANGWVIDVPSDEVRRLRQEEILSRPEPDTRNEPDQPDLSDLPRGL